MYYLGRQARRIYFMTTGRYLGQFAIFVINKYLLMIVFDVLNAAKFVVIFIRMMILHIVQNVMIVMKKISRMN